MESRGPTHTNHVVGGDNQNEVSKTQELCKELQAAELYEALGSKMATIHVLKAEGKAKGLTLGPAVLVGKDPVKALVDDTAWVSHHGVD